MASKPLVLLAVDGDEDRTALASSLLDADLSCEFVTERHEFDQRLRSQPLAAVVLDVKFGGTSAIPLYQSMARRRNDLPVVFRARRSADELELALQATAAGARHILLDPYEKSDLERLVARARDYHTSVSQQTDVGAQPAYSAPGDFMSDWLVGESRAMAGIRSLIKEVADTRAPILIHGEGGTGKEQLAAAVHRMSGRRDGLFVPVDVGALPTGMADQLLFGGGGDPGPPGARIEGKCEAAGGGTLFLSEIGELELSVQPRLLRFLETGQIDRGGGAPPLDLDVRVIASTTQDPRRLVNEGRLREDLYFRLHVVPVRIPPLRERLEDVKPLAQAFLREAAAAHKRPVESLSDEALNALADCPWPGNVRQLRNAIERMVVFSQSPVIGKDAIPQDIRRGVALLRRQEGDTTEEGANSVALLTPLQRQERDLIIDALRRTDDNVVQAAALLHMGQATVYRKIRLYQIAHTRRRRKRV